MSMQQGYSTFIVTRIRAHECSAAPVSGEAEAAADDSDNDQIVLAIRSRPARVWGSAPAAIDPSWNCRMRLTRR
jgi:hypothetical protein